MSKYLPIQTSFLGGEISPLMEMRHDVNGREQAVKEMLNWIIHLQGPARTRGGFKRIAGVEGFFGRIFSFPVTTFTGFIVTITPDMVDVSDNDGVVHSDQLIENSDFVLGGLGWTADFVGAATVIFSGGACTLTPGAIINQYASIRSSFVTVVGEDYHVVVQTVTGDDAMRVRIGTSLGGGEYLDEVFDTTATINHILEALGTTVYVECYVAGTLPAKVLDSVSAHTHDPTGGHVEFVSPWTTPSEIEQIQVGMAPGDPAMYLVSPGVAPQVLTYNPATQVWALAPMATVSEPAEWTATAGAYPAALTFFEGRLYLGGSITYPEQFWGSYSYVYEDFTTGPLPADALTYIIGKKGHIRWMEGASTLVVGTENGEHIATSVGGILITGDINMVQQSANGSAPTQAVTAGDNIMYITSDRLKIRSMSFDWSREAWLSHDVTYGAEHITGPGRLLSHLSFGLNPFSILGAVLSDGTAITATYDPNSKVAGFQRHDTQGLLLSMVTKKFAGVDEYWLLVDRNGGSDELSLERLDLETRMDAYTTFEFEVPTDELTGLDYLANRTCQVLVDDSVHPDVVVGADGTATLQRAGVHMHIGLQFISRIVTAVRDDGKRAEDGRVGSARSSVKRWSKVFVRILNSYKPLINGRRPPERTAPALMDEIQPRQTEYVQASLRGFDREALITIEQDLPLDTTVSGIFGDLSQENYE